MEANQKYAIIGVDVLLVGYAGYKWYTNSKTTTGGDSTQTPAPAAFNIITFLNGTWGEEYTFADGSKGSDEIVINGSVINYQGKPEFDIVGKTYDDATKTLHLSYDRRNSTDKFDATFTVDVAKKVMTGTENDGAIKLVWTKK